MQLTLLTNFLSESLDLGLGLGGAGTATVIGLVMYFWKDIVRLIEKWMDKKKSKKDKKLKEKK